MTEVSSSRSAFNRRPDRNRGRRQGVRALLPLGIVTVVAAGVALSPELASANPALPPITAQALLTKLAGTTADTYSGTLNVTTNLGLPALPDLGSGANPLSLLSGTHVIQVAADGPEKQRIALLNTESEYDLIHNGQQLWIYDSDQNAVEQGTLPSGRGKNTDKAPTKDPAAQPGALPLTPAQAVQQLLAAITPTTELTVASTQNVAGRAAYTLVITPKQSGSLISRVEIAVDAQNGAPLRVALYSVKAPATPVFQLGFTSVSFSAPPDSRFEFTAPKGATISPLSGGMTPSGEQPLAGGGASEPKALGQGWLSVLEVHGVGLQGGELSGFNSFSSEPLVVTKGQKGTSLQNVIVRHGHGHSDGDGVGNVSEASAGGPNPTGLFNGNIQSYLQALGNAGTSVSGAFGSGKLYSTNFVTVLITNDGRLFIGAVAPSVLEADANAQGTR